MSLSLSGIAAEQRSRRYITARRWASRQTREVLEHVVASLFARQMAGLGQYGTSALARRRDQKAVQDRTIGYVLKGKLQASRGGKKAGEEKRDEAAIWHGKCVDKARQMLANGAKRRDLASMLAPGFKKTPRQVRDVLKKAEVK
jgi:hypothetical protein